MATKTLILRPTSTIEASEISATPSDTAVENYHLLVNEIECDEDATGIIFDSTDDYIIFGIDDIDLQDFNIIDMKVYVNSKKSSTAVTNFNLLVQFYNNSELLDELITTSELSATYKLLEMNLNEMISSFNQNIDNIRIKCSYTKSGNKAVMVYLSQLYLVLTVETPDTYIKEQNNWQGYRFSSYYRKKNNIWMPVTKDILKDSYKYILKIKEE